MRFDRADPTAFSPVERAVLRALGVERLDFRPLVSRERVVPQREIEHRRMLAEELARLARAR
jgi:hypothetical protein